MRALDRGNYLELWGSALQLGAKIRLNDFTNLVDVIARETKVHPIKDYLFSLSWDGIPRLHKWLETYARVNVSDLEVSKYVSEVGKLLFVAAVKRIMEPGCKFDEVIVLEGPQFCGKSRLARKMAKHDSWFTDSISLKDDVKETIEKSKGKWIVELAEMKGIRQADNDSVKRNLSRQTDSARLAYDRGTTNANRHFIYIGTMNVAEKEDKYFTDQTGNRRYWPIRVGEIDIDGFERDLDQLYAEAVARWNAGESVEMGADIRKIAEKEQNKRLAENPIANTLRDHFDDIACGAILVEDVQLILGIKDNWHKIKDMGICMAQMGFEKKQLTWFNGKKRTCYVKNDNSVVAGGEPKYSATEIEGKRGVYSIRTANEI